MLPMAVFRHIAQDCVRTSVTIITFKQDEESNDTLMDENEAQVVIANVAATQPGHLSGAFDLI